MTLHRAPFCVCVCRLREEGELAYISGGWVRDALLGRPSADIDIATSATRCKETPELPLSWGFRVVARAARSCDVQRGGLAARPGRKGKGRKGKGKERKGTGHKAVPDYKGNLVKQRRLGLAAQPGRHCLLQQAQKLTTLTTLEAGPKRGRLMLAVHQVGLYAGQGLQAQLLKALT
eukprot:scaffold241057_cov17-Tisochrysis_lutea.AAC.1